MLFVLGEYISPQSRDLERRHRAGMTTTFLRHRPAGPELYSLSARRTAQGAALVPQVPFATAAELGSLAQRHLDLPPTSHGLIVMPKRSGWADIRGCVGSSQGGIVCRLTNDGKAVEVDVLVTSSIRESTRGVSQLENIEGVTSGRTPR